MASPPSTEGYSQAWLEVEKQLGTRPLLSGPPTELREQYAAMGNIVVSMRGPPDGSVITKGEIANGVPVRIYTPASHSDAQLPIGVYFHGGGWVVGNLDSEDEWCRIIAQKTDCILVSADYRLGPENKMPAMLEDCVTAFKWTHKNASSLGGSPSNIFTIGCSAGGGLALTVASSLITSGLGSQVRGIVAIVPVTTHRLSVPSEYASHYTAYTENESGVPIIDAATMATFIDAAGAKHDDPGVFISLADNLKDFPRTYICTCGKDPLRDDGKILEMMLEKEGVQTKSHFYEGLPHYWWMVPGVGGREEFFDNVAGGAKWVLGGE